MGWDNPTYNVREHKIPELETTASLFEWWMPSATRRGRDGGLEDKLERLEQSMATSLENLFVSNGGIGFGDGPVGLSIDGMYGYEDPADVEFFDEYCIDEFESGELYVVSANFDWSYFPARLYSRRETQGWVHRGFRQFADNHPTYADKVREVESRYYDVSGLAAFIEDRISGKEQWEHLYPLDNPKMMAAMAEAHPNFDYDSYDQRWPEKPQKNWFGFKRN